MIPVDDGIDALLGELDRVVTKGAKGVFIPYFSVLPYWDVSYEPFWAAAEQAPVAVCIHRTMGGREPQGRRRRRPTPLPG